MRTLAVHHVRQFRRWNDVVLRVDSVRVQKLLNSLYRGLTPMKTRISGGFAIALAVSLCAPMATMSAQRTVDALKGRIPTTVALVDHLYQGRSVVIIRRPARDGGDVIVLAGPAVTAGKLAAAAVSLTTLREFDGDDVTKRSTVALPESLLGPQSEMGAATRVLGTLSKAPQVDVAGLGLARTTVIQLPDASERKRLSEKAKAKFGKRSTR